MQLLIGLSLALDAVLLGAFIPLELTKRRLRRDRGGSVEDVRLDHG